MNLGIWIVHKYVVKLKEKSLTKATFIHRHFIQYYLVKGYSVKLKYSLEPHCCGAGSLRCFKTCVGMQP